MFTNYLAMGSALLAVASAAPLATRGCTEGQFNCLDGSKYQQCVSGGTWSVTMSVSAGMACTVGISADPFIVAGSGSGSSPAPVTTQPAPQPTTTTAAPPPAQTTTAASPPPPAQTTTPAGAGACDASKGFPCMSTWLSWDALKSKYSSILGSSCAAQGWGANNSPAESAQVLAAIESQAGTVDPRFILATVIQESSGCVRVITTNNGVRNPGLLQDSNGSHTCNDNGSVQNPCPVDEINGMIADGVSGGANNLKAALATALGAGYTDSYAYAVAARIYNSGSYDPSNLSNGLGSTPSYVTDMMARLTGQKL